MRIPKWLFVVFFASLALNFGVLAGYIYQRQILTQANRHARHYFSGWAPDAERRFTALINERREERYRLDSLRLQINARLWELSYEPAPDSAEVESLLSRAAVLEREVAALAYRTGRGISQLQPPELRLRSKRVLRKMMGLPDSASTDDTSRLPRKQKTK